MPTHDHDADDDYDVHYDRAIDEAGRSSLFYGQPAGDLPSGTAPPLGWRPPNFVALQAVAREVERQRMVRAMHAGVPPPRRAEYAEGEEGREAFRAKRREWYELATGDSLEGVSTAEQHRLCNAFARRFRAYTQTAARIAPRPRRLQRRLDSQSHFVSHQHRHCQQRI